MDPQRAGSMKDPICGMTGTIKRDGRWFCSEHCVKLFEQQPPHVETRRWYRDPWVWVPLTGIVLSTLGRWWPSGAGISAIYLGYVRKSVGPFLLGLLIGGVIDHFIPKAYIVKLLSGPRKRVIARATMLGFLASSCSHGCLALTIELYRKGASVPAAVSFLLASPWASMSLTFLLVSLFGVKGLVIVGCALGIASATGLIFQRLARRGVIEANPNTVAPHEKFSVMHDLAGRWRRYPWTARQAAADMRGVIGGMMPLGRMVLGWFQLGLTLSAVLGGLIPHQVFEQWVGPSAMGLLVTVLVATVIEVCSEGTAPLAFELFRQTGALGNSFAFLMGGVVTDYTELGALWTNIGRRTALWMVIVALPMVVLVGLVLNMWR